LPSVKRRRARRSRSTSANASEAVHYAQDHKFALYWKGTPAFAKRQRELGDSFVARPVFTRKGATYVGLVPLDEEEKASEKEPS
jgi:hypothetical protein